MQKKLVNNALYNILYKCLIYIFPLIISSYVGRILLPDGVGKVSFVQNIVSYFMTIVALGIPSYGIREIAKCKTLEERNSVFSSLFTINAVSTTICLVCYYTMITTVDFFRQDIILYAIGGIQIAFNYICIDWLYQGLEEYKYIAIRSIIVRIFSLAAVFLFIKNREDAWIYLLINCVVNGGNYIFNIIRAKKFVSFNVKGIEFKRHIKYILALFATVITIDMYTKINTTVIGIIHTNSDVAIYTYADRIVKIPITIFVAINAVMLPKLSVLYLQQKKEQIRSLLCRVQNTVLMLAIPAAVGLFVLSDDIVMVLYGQEFIQSSIVLKTLCPLLIVMTLGDLYGTQALIAIGQERKKFWVTLFAAILNLVISPIMIWKIGVIGACIASLLCEIIVLILYFIIYKKYDRVLVDKKQIVYIMLSTGIMTAVLFTIKLINLGSVVNTAIGIFAGASIYGLSLYLLDKEFKKSIGLLLNRKQLKEMSDE